MSLTYTRGSLTFTTDNKGGFVCQELQSLPDTFVATHAGNDELMRDVEQHIDQLRSHAQLGFFSKEERDRMPEAERFQRGREIFDSALVSIRQSIEGLQLMEKFLFWLGDWWYYTPAIRSQIYFGDTNFVHDNQKKLVDKYIIPILPTQVRENLKGAESADVAVGFGHFALQFEVSGEVRRIVTDTQLFELRGVAGYRYLDVSPEGKPIARSKCRQGGGRAFFDGTRLMSHEKFQTCAPKTVIINGGYKVNSTGCTIVSGMLFDLIDVDDKVACTTGAFLGICEFSNAEAVASYAMSEESGKLMRVEKGEVLLNGDALSPIGVFLPSPVKLLESGFAHYGWSDFEKIVTVQYSSVLVVDDTQKWIEQVNMQFGGRVKNLTAHLTSDKQDALDTILTINPRAVLLDMHLTPAEEFEGLWISRNLIKDGYKGAVMLASGYPIEHLRAMRTLIGSPVHIPGKQLDRVGKCLTNECDCQR